jgi:CPA2 family monovalent cation:H+ antiporter-2
VASLVLVVVVGKAVGVSVGAFLSGQPVRTSVQAGLTLTQIGEFSFVIATLGAALSAASQRLFDVAVGVAVVTSFLTPLLMRQGEAIALRFDARLPRPLQSFVSLYGSWIELLRKPQPDSEARRIRRDIGWLVLHAGVLLGVLIATALNLPWLTERLGTLSGVGPDAARGAALVGAALIGAPFGIGVVRVSRGLAGRLALRALPLPARGVDQGRAPRRTLAKTLEVGIVLASGLVIIAVTGPILPRAALPAIIALVLLYLGGGFLAGRRGPAGPPAGRGGGGGACAGHGAPAA